MELWPHKLNYCSFYFNPICMDKILRRENEYKQQNFLPVGRNSAVCIHSVP